MHSKKHVIAAAPLVLSLFPHLKKEADMQDFDRRPTRTLGHRAALALGALAATGLFGGMASAAVPGYTTAGVISDDNSFSPKLVTATCPPGKQLVSGSGRIRFVPSGLGPQVRLDGFTPLPDLRSFAVRAREDQDGTALNWRLNTVAVCADPLPGLQLVSQTSASDSSTSKVVKALCPSGKNVVGVGADITGGGGEVNLRTVRPSFGDEPMGAVASADEDTPPGTVASWSLRAYAICANPLPGYEVVLKQTPLDTSTTKNVFVGCPSGKVPLGMGAFIGGGDNDGIMFNKVINLGFGGEVMATEDQDGNTFFWAIQLTVICASA